MCFAIIDACCATCRCHFDPEFKQSHFLGQILVYSYSVSYILSSQTNRFAFLVEQRNPQTGSVFRATQTGSGTHQISRLNAICQDVIMHFHTLRIYGFMKNHEDMCAIASLDSPLKWGTCLSTIRI